MENKKLKLDFEISIFDIVDLNKSFAAAKCLVCYTGRNRNKSDIRRDVMENALSSMKNIPVVGRYDVDKDDFGAHDLRVITTDNGVDVVNATVPFGVIPESAKQWFEVREVNGEEKECLFTDVILWKRQHGYQRIAEAETISESMEINVSSFTVDQDNYCIVDKFEFEALCLLGSSVTPCFENACVQMYTNEVVSDFKMQFSEMLKEFKELSLNDNERFNKNNIDNEGGEPLEKLEILKKFNKTVEDLDFSIEEMSTEELSAKMEELFGTNEPAADSEPTTNQEPVVDPEPVADPEPTPEPTPAEPVQEPQAEPQAEPLTFSATYKEKREAANNALPNFVKHDDDGYCIEEIWYYLEDMSDEYLFVERYHWILDGNDDFKLGRLPYEFNEETRTVTIVGEFEEMVKVWLTLEEKAKVDADRANYEATKNAFEEYKLSHCYENEKVDELISFKTNIEAGNVFSKYENRIGETIEFKELKNNAMNYSLEQLEKECIYIVGLHAEEFSSSKPQNESKTIKFSVEPISTPEEEPYGGLMKHYLGR